MLILLIVMEIIIKFQEDKLKKKVILGQFWDIDLENEIIEKFPKRIKPKKIIV